MQTVPILDIVIFSSLRETEKIWREFERFGEKKTLHVLPPSGNKCPVSIYGQRNNIILVFSVIKHMTLTSCVSWL